MAATTAAMGGWWSPEALSLGFANVAPWLFRSNEAILVREGRFGKGRKSVPDAMSGDHFQEAAGRVSSE